MVKKNGDPRREKQNFRCLKCGKQWSENKEAKIINNQTKKLVRKAFLKRTSLNKICKIFDVRMPWLLDFMDFIIHDLPEDLNAQVTCCEKDELKVAKVEGDERWNFVGNKKMISGYGSSSIKKSRHVLARHVGPQDKKTTELLFAKRSQFLKKPPIFH
ncbi:Uncharacterized protein PRO82_001452 [Candidatus Protochlamydia amoebophila]|uniref:hypothetical protein n=1 Tax=Candidatus Protochlamydia amoebophila TaxID=362787 RepID=UPI001BD89C4D|nr:Uncharacterized protein [Candidatus Protochlamydia amoebophila]